MGSHGSTVTIVTGDGGGPTPASPNNTLTHQITNNALTQFWQPRSLPSHDSRDSTETIVTGDGGGPLPTSPNNTLTHQIS